MVKRPIGQKTTKRSISKEGQKANRPQRGQWVKGHREVKRSMGQETNRSKDYKEVNSERRSDSQKANGPHRGRTVKRPIGQKST